MSVINEFENTYTFGHFQCYIFVMKWWIYVHDEMCVLVSDYGILYLFWANSQEFIEVQDISSQYNKLLVCTKLWYDHY